MAQISNKLRSVGGEGLAYECGACKSRHMIRYGDGPGERWGWNGNVDAPTFTPSVLTTNGHNRDTYVVGKRCWCVYSAEHSEQINPFLPVFAATPSSATVWSNSAATAATNGG